MESEYQRIVWCPHETLEVISMFFYTASFSGFKTVIKLQVAMSSYFYPLQAFFLKIHLQIIFL